jgi:hypothetical protein
MKLVEEGPDEISRERDRDTSISGDLESERKRGIKKVKKEIES